MAVELTDRADDIAAVAEDAEARGDYARARSEYDRAATLARLGRDPGRAAAYSQRARTASIAAR